MQTQERRADQRLAEIKRLLTIWDMEPNASPRKFSKARITALLVEIHDELS